MKQDLDGVQALAMFIAVLFLVIGCFVNAEMKRQEIENSPFEVVEGQSNVPIEDGHLTGSIVRDKETGKEYIIPHKWFSSRMVPRE